MRRGRTILIWEECKRRILPCSSPTLRSTHSTPPLAPLALRRGLALKFPLYPVRRTHKHQSLGPLNGARRTTLPWQFFAFSLAFFASKALLFLLHRVNFSAIRRSP
jgi:hypothetical protein